MFRVILSLICKTGNFRQGAWVALKISDLLHKDQEQKPRMWCLVPRLLTTTLLKSSILILQIIAISLRHARRPYFLTPSIIAGKLSLQNVRMSVNTKLTGLLSALWSETRSVHCEKIISLSVRKYHCEIEHTYTMNQLCFKLCHSSPI
jgi:hypothetical protein